MSYIHVEDKPITLYTLLCKREDVNITLSRKQCYSALVGVCKGLQYIHGRGYLHNDIKLDKIVLGTTSTGELKPYIVDFGKAPRIDCGKMYTPNDSERQQFKVEHTHIAPDLRDGRVPQLLWMSVRIAESSSDSIHQLVESFLVMSALI